MNAFLEEHPGDFDLVEWVLFNQDTYDAYDKVLAQLTVSKIVQSPDEEE